MIIIKNKKFLMVAGGIVAVLVVVGYGYPAYKGWSGRRGVENLANALKQAEKEDYKLALADTHGGKTPQETLDMFIKAVEEGDYELASKYFIIAKQEEWENGLIKTKEANKIEFLLEKIKETKTNIHNGRYSEERDWFRVDEPISIEFMLYPSGNWKIIEI